ncbi:hypothetical protein AB0K51_01885 [Kitasatospora sp. NPDC049285]|uniref:hypothetical protein n=1 Tax=Kitasatospora sp. NPDC049285 TaxID=3157096 RepID=UPI0034244B8C
MSNAPNPAHSQQAAAPPTLDSSWNTDIDVMARLSTATLTLLDVLVHRLDDELVFSEALCGGGEFMCELEGLDDSFGPLIEAEAARVVAEAAGLRPAGLFSPWMPAYLAAIDALSRQRQANLVLEAADRYAGATSPPNPRIAAFHARSTVRPHTVTASASAALTAAPRPSTAPRR